jgi:hypothetical protein
MRPNGRNTCVMHACVTVVLYRRKCDAWPCFLARTCVCAHAPLENGAYSSAHRTRPSRRRSTPRNLVAETQWLPPCMAKIHVQCDEHNAKRTCTILAQKCQQRGQQHTENCQRRLAHWPFWTHLGCIGLGLFAFPPFGFHSAGHRSARTARCRCGW